MFPMHALIAHAELNSNKVSTETAEARVAPRRSRAGNLTLYPCVARSDSYFAQRPSAEGRVIASISNISATGLGLIAAEPLADGLEFDVQWDEVTPARRLRFAVVHSRPSAAGMYRVGARLIQGELPEEPESTDRFPATDEIEFEGTVRDALSAEVPEVADEPADDESAAAYGGIMRFSPDRREPTAQERAPAPPGTFQASAAFGFDKTEKLDGRTTCGWERSIEMRRDGDRMWVYIHSPGKKNGWGLYVDAGRFESAVGRIQSAAESPFITSMAA